MCGIVGYAGNKNSSKIIYNGLKRLEYRGYDSAGIATLYDNKINVYKKRGRVNCLEKGVKILRGNVGIGHTRWATHGEPSDINSHPHADGKFAIVHNGIIENFSTLKEEYFKGQEFLSQTDSEIIVKLLNKFYDGNILNTVKKVTSLLLGSYAVAIVCVDFNGIIAAKKNNPIVIGFSKHGNFIASDAPALAEECNKITFLEDGDIAMIDKNEVEIYDGSLNSVVRKKHENIAQKSDLLLKNYPHYMLKEINEVPMAIERTAFAYYPFEERVKKIFKGVDRIIIIGCGTAYNSGLVAKRYFEGIARITTECEIASEFRYKNPLITKNTLVIAISQSGETADTVEGAILATNKGAKVLSVTNAPYSQLTRISSLSIPVGAGAEICVAATKSYSGQIAALYLIANTAGGVGLDIAIDKLFKLPKLCRQVLKTVNVNKLADMCASSSGVYFLGRDIDYAVAIEGSLKLKEISYIPSEGYPTGELKHGTLALIDIRTVGVVIITNPDLVLKSENGIEQILSRRGKVGIITDISSTAEKYSNRAEVITIPQSDKYLSPLLTSLILQLLSYATCILLDRDPDKPRNLAKSVTVE